MQTTHYNEFSHKLGHAYRIAVVADTHGFKNDRVFRNLKDNKPDIIFCLGDIVYGAVIRNQSFPRGKNWLNEFPYAVELIKTLPTIAPTYFVYGNHEWLLSEDDVRLLQESGMKILDNEWVNHGELLIGGLSAADVTNYWTFKKRFYASYPNYKEGNLEREYIAGDSYENRKAPDSSWLPEFEEQNGYKILLCHHPEYWAVQNPYLKDRRIDLVLAGHSHGGQVRIFGQGFYTSGQGRFPKYTAGVHEGQYGKMIVSRGLSNTSKIPRLFNPIEMVYVNLKGNTKNGRENA